MESGVNLKLKFRKSNCLPVSYDVGRLQDENLRETFQEEMNTNMQNLKFDNVKDRWNNFSKTILVVADGVLGKKIRSTDRNISEKPLCKVACARII